MIVNEDVKTALGQCFWIGLDGTEATEESTRRIFETFQPGGIILFQRNVSSMRQVKTLNSLLQKKCSIPLLVAVDQEGGTVERLQDLIGTIPPAMAFVAAGSKPLIRQVHRSHARLLRYLGFNVNFTPVLDLALPRADNAIGTRCYSNRPNVVIEWAKEVLEAHLDEGVLPCGKHFPGLGDALLDTHIELPSVSSSWDKIEKKDLLPYRKLLPQLPLIMVNHALYPEKNSRMPASLAPEIVSDLLLHRWGYRGLSISDDLNMGAIANLYQISEATELALKAGNHQVLICKPQGVIEAYDDLLGKLADDSALAQAVLRSSNRILAFKFQHLKSSGFDEVDPEAEITKLEKLSTAVAQRALTQARAGKPLQKPLGAVTVYAPRTKWVKGNTTALAAYLRARKAKVAEFFYPLDVSEDTARSLARSSPSKTNIVVLANAFRFPNQRILIEELLLHKREVAVVSGAFPLDSLPKGIRLAINAYWTSPAALEAAARVLIGERHADGDFPLKV